jgi:hypothetical protein
MGGEGRGVRCVSGDGMGRGADVVIGREKETWRLAEEGVVRVAECLAGRGEG